MTPEQMDKLLDRLVQKMVDEGQITVEEPSEQQTAGAGRRATARQQGASSKSPTSRSIFWASRR